ncbi:MAG: ATP-binding cassette domain-containing protein, partial [Methanosarcinales archaeon]
LRFFAEIFGVNKNLAEERIKNLLTALNLNPKKIGDLSKGMKRKVAIARSLINDPQILIYDEPTSGLDPMTSKYITDFIHSLKKNKTIVFSAHNLHQVESISDRVLILKEGSIIAEGTMDEIRKKYGSTEYQVEFQADGVSVPWAEPYNGHYLVKTRDIDKVNYITKLISKNKGNIIGVRTKESSLEDIFLKLIIQN